MASENGLTFGLCQSSGIAAPTRHVVSEAADVVDKDMDMDMPRHDDIRTLLHCTKHTYTYGDGPTAYCSVVAK